MLNDVIIKRSQIKNIKKQTKSIYQIHDLDHQINITS